MAYNGRKLGEYIRIPKSKTYLREYREILKLCKVIQDEDGFFSDKSLGIKMVSLRAIVDRDNTAESYVDKYENKSIGNQSYVSNARMLIRIFRWLGFITCDYDNNKGKFYLTPYGKLFSEFKGDFPSQQGTLSEYSLFLEAFGVMRFHSVNDNPSYRNEYFNQRMFFNMIRFLDILGYASHYELALSALVLRDETVDELSEKLDKIQQCRESGKNIRRLMNEYGLNCDDKSKVTGIYDGPKVLLSFARQLGLVEELVLIGDEEQASILTMYKRMYKDSGHITPKSIKKLSKITSLGRDFVKKFKDYKLIRYHKLHNPLISSATYFILRDYGAQYIKDTKFLDLDANLFDQINGKLVCKKGVLYDLYRDVPFEDRKNVINLITQMCPIYFHKEMKEETKEMIAIIQEKPYGKCINCSNLGCKVYPKHRDTFGASDRFPDQICPENIIKTDSNGVLNIDSDKCASCGLCAMNCPFDGISYKTNFKFYKNDMGSTDMVELPITEKEKLTLNYLEMYSISDNKINITDIPGMMKSFLNHITKPGNQWDKDKCYLYVRNVFRTFGVHATYSGSGGMKTRSDVTILAPFVAVSEVKSPAESPVNMKAVRQAIDAAVQMNTKLTMAIGHTIHQGAIDQEAKYYASISLGVLLLELKFLAFFQYTSGYIKYTPESLRRLITNYHGAFNKQCLIAFIKGEYLEGTKSSLPLDEVIALINLCY